MEKEKKKNKKKKPLLQTFTRAWNLKCGLTNRGLKELFIESVNFFSFSTRSTAEKNILTETNTSAASYNN